MVMRFIVLFVAAYLDEIAVAKSATLPQNQMTPADLKVKVYISKIAGPEDISIVANKSTSQLFVLKGDQLLATAPFLQGLSRKDEFPGGSMEAAFLMPIPVQEKMVSPPGKFRLSKIENVPE